jgi:cellulose synthase/poly-beta-1,6-N-acetylglucosamine synthase-like glycosyltransferase
VNDDSAFSDLPLVSVIVPAYNAEGTISACLENLSNQSYPKKCYEIVVIDDGSTDCTFDLVEASNIKCKSQPNQGPASARNNGVLESVGSIVLFTDSDCVPDLNWIEEMVTPFQDSDVAGVKGAYRTKQKELAARFAQAEFEDRYDLLKKSVWIDMVDTYSAAFRKDVFLSVGGFDENFPVANNEDTDLSYRLVHKGFKLVFSERARVYHTHPDTIVKYLKTKFWRGYWRIVVYRRYPDKAIKDSYTPTVVKLQTMIMAISLPFLALSIIQSSFIYPVIFMWAGIMASSFPFALKTYNKDKIVGALSPLFVFFRSAVFALGSLLGVGRCVFFDRNKKKS